MHKKIPDSYSKREGGDPGNSGLLSQQLVTVCLSVPPTKQFCEAPVVMVQWFVCLSVTMTTSQGNGYGTQSIGWMKVH